ncbi:hypothetical protein [Streptomyces sp. NPDC058249]|uniref:hypothetical protein n=1 Tax=Streptomyces sp. NPDC058249 TaxID=3346403 RepID=UPI0036ECD747
MKLAEAAILVSVTSALFTGTNMLISAATYRRGGPRLKLRIIRAPHRLYDAYKAGDQTKWRAYLHVHVMNRSGANVKVEKVQIIPHMLPMPGRRAIVRSLEARMDHTARATFIEGENRMNIDPFDGVKWIVNHSLRPESLRALARGRVILQLRVTLANGMDVYSHPFSARRLAKSDEAIRKNIERIAQESGLTGQLAFDDLEEDDYQ